MSNASDAVVTFEHGVTLSLADTADHLADVLIGDIVDAGGEPIVDDIMAADIHAELQRIGMSMRQADRHAKAVRHLMEPIVARRLA